MSEIQNITAAELAIWGGVFPATDLAPFCAAWATVWPKLPWRVWEWVSDIVFEHQTTAPTLASTPARQPEWLERLRAFGADGDLEVRRDGEAFHWRFVGKPTAFVAKALAAHPFELCDYWKKYPTPLMPVARHALLWGQEMRDTDENPLGVWQDDRVSSVARLVYPGMSDKSEVGRVQLCYREYLSGGNVAAVWWHNLEGWEATNVNTQEVEA